MRLTSDTLGSFDESFQWQLRGSSVPVPLVIRGRIIGPTFELDSREVDFGIVSFGFRWAACSKKKRHVKQYKHGCMVCACVWQLCWQELDVQKGFNISSLSAALLLQSLLLAQVQLEAFLLKLDAVLCPSTQPHPIRHICIHLATHLPTRRYVKELLLTNTSAIPLAYTLRLVEEPLGSTQMAGTSGNGPGPPAPFASSSSPSGVCKEFTIMPAKGTVLPRGSQRIQVEFMPQVLEGLQGRLRHGCSEHKVIPCHLKPATYSRLFKN